VQSLIDSRRAAYPRAKKDLEAGFKIFTTTCVACHSIDGKGGLVGPQLDGIGNRGLDRVLEDVLDPNRSVDPAFYSWNVSLKDGTEITGIQRREEGETIVYADPTGKEVAVPKSQIVKRNQSKLSLMPTNFGEVIPEKDFYDLMGFLMSKTAQQLSK
jgi:putative heme-binding domain-containing protein